MIRTPSLSLCATEPHAAPKLALRAGPFLWFVLSLWLLSPMGRGHAADVALGAEIFDRDCFRCHGPTGVTMGGSLTRLSAIAAGRRPHGGGTAPFAGLSSNDLAALSAFLSSLGFQEFLISGRVTDVQGAPVPGVTVQVACPYLDYPPRVGVTDGDGSFLFEGFPNGDHRVELSAEQMRFSPAFEKLILDGQFGRGEGLEYTMYRSGDIEPPPPRMVQRVSPSGDDLNDGRSWASAKYTISEALRQLPEGGEVWLAAGTYYEPVSLTARSLYGGFIGTETNRAQRDWRKNITILDGTPAILESLGYFADSLMVLEGVDFEQSVVDGLTLQNARALSGGALFLGYRALTTIQHCTLLNNTALEAGGGILCSSTAEATIRQNVLEGNASAYGGALQIQAGGIVHLLANNLFSHNHGQLVAGIACDGEIRLAAHNTLVHNQSDSGGTLAYLQGTGTNLNNIFAFNSSGVEDEVGTAQWTHNAVFGNGGMDWLGVAPQEEDVSADPLFVDAAAHDFHLQAGSPCENRGLIDVRLTDEADLEDHHRFPLSGVDLGAYEREEIRLAIQRRDHDLVLSWSTTDAGWLLQESRDLQTPRWLEVSGVHVEQGIHSVVVPIEAVADFYRLRQR